LGTLNRWVIRYSPIIAVKAISQKRETNRSWRMDETYIKVKGEWGYLYRAVDSHGDTLDIHNDLIRKAIIVNSLFEKGCCSLFITTLRQHEIKRITVTINRALAG
jgi:transposase-like protein